MAYLKKDEIIFAQKPRPDYSGIPEREWKPTNSDKHVLRPVSPHNKMVMDLQIEAELKNFEEIEKMELAAQKMGKAIVWYCCEFVRNILEGAIDIGVRGDDFWSVFVASFAGKENSSESKKVFRHNLPDNHQYSGYTCQGNFLYVNIPITDNEPTYEEKLKNGVKYHLKRLENNKISLYYLESLMNDIQHSKEIPAFSGRDKYYREIRPFDLWLEKQVDKIKAKLAKGKYQLTPAEIEELEKKGFDREEIFLANQIVSTYENWLDPNYKIPNFSPGIDGFYLLENGDSTQKGKGKLTLFILPESERLKIKQRKSEILEGFVEAYTKAFIDFFNSNYRGSGEPKRLIEQEIKRLERLLDQDSERVNFTVVTQTLVLHLYTFPNQNRGSMYYHYNEVIVKGLRGEEAADFVDPRHDSMKATELFTASFNDLHFVVAALACKRYKTYLYALLEGNELAPKKRMAGKSKELEVLPSLQDAIKYPDKLPKLWECLSEMDSPFVTEFGNIIGGKKARKHREVMALAQTITPLMKDGLGLLEVYSMLCNRLALDESSRPERLPSKPGYDNIRLMILATIKGVLK